MATSGFGTPVAGVANIANLKCCCGGCLCPDGFTFPSDYVDVTISGLTGVAAVLNGSWVCSKVTGTSIYRYDALISGNRYRVIISCDSGDASTWFTSYSMFYGENEGAGFTYDWTTQVGSGGVTWSSGSDTCGPLYIARTPTGESWSYAIFVPSFSSTTISQTYSLTISR